MIDNRQERWLAEYWSEWVNTTVYEWFHWKTCRSLEECQQAVKEGQDEFANLKIEAPTKWRIVHEITITLTQEIAVIETALGGPTPPSVV